MPYQALYRKFRPTDFEDVKGQDHIVRTLRNEIMHDRIGHAYLFTGTRGTGKTTVAKIFAKAVNCEHPVDGSPCGKCDMCKSIAAGTSMNVIEIDAASNNGVSNIRDIIEEVTYPPTEGKYKVYIIDEVHMLSIGAFNALLKTLEEPPSYVIFILATTEVNKIPVTILSRCQRFDFHRISVDTIAARLSELMEKEQVDVEDRAIRYIARAADGSMRDALSLLDQCIAFYLGQKLTYDDVLKVLGAVDTEVFSRLLRDIINSDIPGAISIIEEVVTEGRELGQFVGDFTWYLRNLLLIKSSDGMEDVLDISTDNLKLLKEEAKMVSDNVLMRYIRILSDLSNQLRYAAQKRVLIEIAIIRLCKPQMDADYSAVTQRLDTIEDELANETFTSAPAQTAANAAPDGGTSQETKPAAVKKHELPAAVPEEVKQAAKQWRSIEAGIGDAVLKNLLAGVMPSVGDEGQFLLVFDAQDTTQKFAYSSVMRDDNLDKIQEAIEQAIGKSVRVEAVLNETNLPNSQAYTDAVTAFGKENGIEVETEDFDGDDVF